MAEPKTTHDESPGAEPPAAAVQPGDGGPPAPPSEQKLNGPLHFGMGAAIGVGAALGIALGSLLGNLAAGLAVGAGLGFAAGAVLESRGRR